MADDVVRARARELYALALRDADWTPDGVCAGFGWTREQLAEVLDALAELGLAAPFPGVSSGWSMHSPATSMAQMLAAGQRTAEELVTAVSRAHTALAQVVTEFQPVHFQQLAEGRIEVAVQPAQIAAILDEASRSSRSEILSLHPGRPLPAGRLSQANDRNRETLQRGVAMRTIHLATSAAAPHMRSHLKQLVGDGAEVRVATTLPMRLIIIDQDVAVVPSLDSKSTSEEEATPPAMVLRSPAMVAVLRQFFEYFWASSTDLISEEGSVGGVSGTRHREVVRLLASGLTDEAIARKLGLSDRTVRRIVAELMQQIGAESRFQAGVKMVRLGWLDDDRTSFDDDVVGSTPLVR